jgi:hypothetical protein
MNHRAAFLFWAFSGAAPADVVSMSSAPGIVAWWSAHGSGDF